VGERKKRARRLNELKTRRGWKTSPHQSVETTKALESKLPKKKKVSVRERSRTGPRQRGRTLAELTRKKKKPNSQRKHKEREKTETSEGCNHQPGKILTNSCTTQLGHI
jgi:hypothetical protein